VKQERPQKAGLTPREDHSEPDAHDNERARAANLTAEELNEWAVWALAQADGLDPVATGAYRNKPIETPD
jgi:hypothetical protein